MSADRVRELIAQELSVALAAVTDGARFCRDLGADSLDVVELTMCFEERFGVSVSDEEAEACICVADALRLLRSKGLELVLAEEEQAYVHG